MAFDVSYVFKAIDKFSSTAKKIQRSMDNVGNKSVEMGRKLQTASKSMSSFGKAAAVRITAPILALQTLAAIKFDKQIQAQTLVQNAIKSTGGSAELTAKQLFEAASAIQRVTEFGDEDILRGSTLSLLKFQNISGETFLRTQELIVDISKATGRDLMGTADQIGRALDDPISNLTLLKRTGISFTKSQEDMIKGLQEVGRVTESQAILLDLMEEKFKGAGKAAAKVGLGPIRQLNNTFGDILETFGDVILNGLNPFILGLERTLSKFNDLSPRTRKIIVILSALAAIIPAIVIALGTLGFAIGGIAIGMGVLNLSFLPVIATITAISAAVFLLIGLFKNLKDIVSIVFSGIKKFTNLIGLTSFSTDGLKEGKAPGSDFEVLRPKVLEISSGFEDILQKTFEPKKTLEKLRKQSTGRLSRFDGVRENILNIRPEFEVMKPKALGIRPEFEFMGKEALDNIERIEEIRPNEIFRRKIIPDIPNINIFGNRRSELVDGDKSMSGEINVNINAPKGAVGSVTSTSLGGATLNVGQNTRLVPSVAF